MKHLKSKTKIIGDTNEDERTNLKPDDDRFKVPSKLNKCGGNRS